MKTTKTVEVATCDFCPSKESTYQTCLKCGKDLCYDCVVGLSESVFGGGNYDLKYCKDCFNKELLHSDDPVFLAYLVVKQLRDEQDGWHAAFKARKEAAEKKAKELLGAERRRNTVRA